VALKTAASEVVVGLPLPREFMSLPADLQGVGTTIGKAMKWTHAIVVMDCVEALISDGRGQQATPIRRRPPTDLEAPQVERIKERFAFGGAADRDSRVRIYSDDPYDIAIYSLSLEGDVQP
jgi:hypothetical protein